MYREWCFLGKGIFQRFSFFSIRCRWFKINSRGERGIEIVFEGMGYLCPGRFERKIEIKIDYKDCD